MCKMLRSLTQFDALGDFVRIPTVCRYALAVLGIWLGSSALLSFASCSQLGAYQCCPAKF